MKKTIELLPKQMEFLRSDASNLLYSGAAGAGKTRVLCFKVRDLALQEPNGLIGLFRKRRSDLINTTLRTLLKGDGGLPPILKEGTYNHNKNDSIISIDGGGEIFYTGLDDEKKIGSLNLSHAAVDEAIELDEEEWDFLQTRLRNDSTDNHQVFAATNPSTPSHFLYDRFFNNDDEDVDLIQTKTTDNFFLPDDYIQRLEKLQGVAYDRLVLGKWAAYEGLIFGELETQERDQYWDEIIAGVDAGYHHPHCLIIGISERPHVIKEIVGEEITEAEFADKVSKNIERDLNVMSCDPACPSLIQELKNRGLPAQPADNDVLSGISSVLELNPTISPGCNILNKQKLSYKWDEDKQDKPVKKDDHGPDALRYALHDWKNYGSQDWSI